MTRRSHALTEAERSRIDHVDHLVTIGVPGTRALIATLSDPSWTVRRAAVSALASLGDDAAEQLCVWLRTARTNETAIAAAVDVLAASIGPHVVEKVLALVDDKTPAVVADAAQILGRRRAAEAVPTLARLVEHADDNVAVAAIEALGMIGGTNAVEALIGVIDKRSFFRTFPAMQVLARTGDPRAIPPLVALLEDDTYRIEVVRALGRTGLAQAIAPIASLLQSPSDSILRLVAVSLADLVTRADFAGAGEAIAVPLRTALVPWLGRLAGALRGADPGERAAIATLLGRAGDLSILSSITTLLDDTATADVATNALQQLGRMSADVLVSALRTADPVRRAAILPLVQNQSAAPAVRDLLARDSEPEVRARACEALARLRDTASVPLLFAALGDPSPRVTHAAVAAIHALGTTETETLALEAVHSEKSSVRRNAIRLLGAFGYPSGFEALRSAVDDSDRRTAELAIVGLGAIDDPRVDDVLANLATSRDDALRAAVMRAASHRNGTTAVKLLMRGLADGEAWVRYYAAQGLGRLGVQDAQTSKLLIERLRDQEPLVRVAAIEALSRLGSDDAFEAVCRAAASDDPDERRAGLVGLGMQARAGAASHLLEAAASSDPATRLVALSGVARLGDPRAVTALGRAIDDPVREVRDAALSLLGERDDDAAAQILVDCALRAEPAAPVHLALSRPTPMRILAIVTRLEVADDRSAPVLAAALARMHVPAATAALFEALTLGNPAARSAAANALVAIDARGARPAIETLSTTDPDPEVRRICAALVAS